MTGSEIDRLAEALTEALVWYVGVLDGVPDYARAVVAGLLLVPVLQWSQSRVPERDIQFSISFAKVSLIALAATPLVVWLLPAVRLVVFVEELEPASAPGPWAWLAVPLVWGAGFAVGAARLFAGYVRAARRLAALPAVEPDHALAARVRHWQRRLGFERRLTLVLTADPAPQQLPGQSRIALPAALLHWPAPARDLVIIRSLCQRRKNHGRWHLFALLVAACYWPLPWLRRLHGRLLEDFEVVTDNLAAACYEDDLGYRRALRQVEQRLGAAAAPAGAASAEPGRGIGRRIGEPGAYRRHLTSLWSAPPWPVWPAALSGVHERRRTMRWAEPGERLVVLVGQAVFLAFLVGGVTLREFPPEVERDYSLRLDESWMKSFHRDQERLRLRRYLEPEAADGAR